MAKFTVEADDGRNSRIDWKPAKIKLRSRFSTQNFIPREMQPNGIRKMPNIPGQRIEVDTDGKYARVFDPLEEPTSKALLAEINAAAKVMPALESGNKFSGVPQTKYSLRDPLDMNTWTYWIRQYVTLGYFKLVDGVIPHVKGNVKCNFDDFTEKAVKVRKVDTEEEDMNAQIEAQERASLALVE